MKKLLGLVLAACIIVAGGVAVASIPDGSGVIHGCYRTSSGHDLRVIDSSTESCTSNEVALNWNQTGPQGATGATGPAGPSSLAATLSTRTEAFQPGNSSSPANCGAGQIAVGGGFVDISNGDVSLISSRPIFNDNQSPAVWAWSIGIHNPTANAVNVTLYAVCVSGTMT